MQSLVVTVLAVLAYLLARKADKTFREVEDLAGYLADRLRPTLRKGTKLTSREQEVLALIGEGALTDAELGERLHVAPATAKTHVRTLLRPEYLVCECCKPLQWSDRSRPEATNLTSPGGSTTSCSNIRNAERPNITGRS